MNGVEIQGLTVRDREGTVVHPLDVRIAPGRTLAIIGESGSGKTLTAKALVGLLPRGFRAAGSARVDDAEVDLDATQTIWRAVRGSTVTLLLQDPFTSLSPVHRCGEQIGWTLDAAADRRLTRVERERAVAERLAEVRLPAHVARSYPHQLSGGMRQRVAIAAALAADPQLIIADEPTTALDASNQAEILDLLRSIQQARNLCVVLISHDLGLVRGRADDVLVMRHGEVVERGTTGDVLSSPTHPYTRALLDADPALAQVTRVSEDPSPRAQGAPLLSATHVTKRFGDRTVLDGVSVDVAPGQIVGLVGESGSGKSTFARCVAGLEQEDAGEIRFDGVPLAPGRRSRTPGQMQIVFQDPYSSLNPMMSVGSILREALAVARRPATDLAELLSMVNLPTEFERKRPAELSGGQRQRVAIARALATRPRLLICDESVSALDVSVQAQILSLLSRLREELGIAILFISHDLAVVRMLADEVTVLWNGRVVESGTCAQVLEHPRHEYTATLVAAGRRENQISTSEIAGED